ncbi:hypothetical protein, variant [Spizellomyces punctatus DAOM BR117]|nr:hypothetical protein, variant [Spizellomyces punctatus DAOM BR117]KNC99904.1 hypothetical protein, variant [Spizellomyces punctatus DAOM BR117]|eukprot:XP_016607944.1 hypothetical protein, variant [Spizellomyces punctatus DAOM BR117]
MDVAQRTHQWEQGIKMRFLGYKSEPIRPLNDARAVELGANFMSESVIFSVAVLTILGEAYRSSRKTTQRRLNVDEALEQLQIETQQTQETITQMQENIQKLTTQVEILTVENRRLERGLDLVAKALNVRIEKEEAAKQRGGWWNGWWSNGNGNGKPDQNGTVNAKAGEGGRSVQSTQS